MVPSVGVTLIVAIGSAINIVEVFSIVLFSLSDVLSVIVYAQFSAILNLKLPGYPFHPFLYKIPQSLFSTCHWYFIICLPPSGVDALPSIRSQSLASCEANLIGISSFSFLLFTSMIRLAALGHTFILVSAVPSKIHCVSALALLTVRCTT